MQVPCVCRVMLHGMGVYVPVSLGESVEGAPHWDVLTSTAWDVQSCFAGC